MWTESSPGDDEYNDKDKYKDKETINSENNVFMYTGLNMNIGRHAIWLITPTVHMKRKTKTKTKTKFFKDPTYAIFLGQRFVGQPDQDRQGQTRTDKDRQ